LTVAFTLAELRVAEIRAIASAVILPALAVNVVVVAPEATVTVLGMVS
jgi:hypothetical protein